MVIYAFIIWALNDMRTVDFKYLIDRNQKFGSYHPRRHDRLLATLTYIPPTLHRVTRSSLSLSLKINGYGHTFWFASRSIDILDTCLQSTYTYEERIQYVINYSFFNSNYNKKCGIVIQGGVALLIISLSAYLS